MEGFQAVCEYLQQRISKTRLAKSNGAKGHRSCPSFEDAPVAKYKGAGAPSPPAGRSKDKP